MSRADEFFGRMNEYYARREEMCYLISQVTGLVLIDDMWHQITFDLTDKSFELHNVAMNVSLTLAQCNDLMNLGFDQWWFNFVDGIEKHYYKKDNEILCTTRTRDDSMNVAKKPEKEGVN